MAGAVAAPDASPPAAVLAVPRGEEVGSVACDALLEGEQGGPLRGDAAAAMGVLELQCTAREDAYDAEEEQEVSCAMHAGRTGPG